MRNERLFIENHEYKRESKQTLVEVLYARIWLHGGEGDVKKGKEGCRQHTADEREWWLCNMVNRRKVYIEKKNEAKNWPLRNTREQFRIDDVEFPRRTVCDRPIKYEENMKQYYL